MREGGGKRGRRNKNIFLLFTLFSLSFIEPKYFVFSTEVSNRKHAKL